jgi:hypothetical protein
VSRLRAEFRWFLINYALLNAVWFLVGLVWGTVLAIASADFVGSYGSPLEAVFWWAVAVVFYLPLIFGIPVLGAALLIWRIAIRLVGHPRLTAYLTAAGFVGAAFVLIPRIDLPSIAFLAAGPLFAYATIVRPPPHASIRAH